ncbi:MAG: YdcH family protein [Pseudomonadota bacterium]
MHARLKSLQAKTDILNAKIQQELTRPYPCSLRLQALKRKRLRMKDEIVHAAGVLANLGLSVQRA